MSVKGVLYSLLLSTAAQRAISQQTYRSSSRGVPVPTSQPPNSTTRTTGPAPAITLNAVNASFEWWYSSTASQTISTISVLYNEEDECTGWTLIPPTKSWDVLLAISTYGCDRTPIARTLSDGSIISYTSCGYKPSHVAAATTGVYLSVYKVPASTSGTDTTTIPNVGVSSTPSPSIAFPGSTTISSGIPFVYFTAYEITGTSCIAQSCSVVRQTSRLPQPYVFEYAGPDPANITAVATGTLDPAFPAFVKQTSAVAGIWTAEPTVIVVVVQVIVAVAVLAAHVEKSAASLAVPTFPDANIRVNTDKTPVTVPTSVKAEAVQTSTTPQASPDRYETSRTRPEHYETAQAQGDAASYIATGIGMTYPTSRPELTSVQSSNDVSQQTTQEGTLPSSSSPASYTPGNSASTLTYSGEQLGLVIGSLLIALAYI